MDNEERQSNTKESVESCCDAACGGQIGGSETSPSCCEDLSRPVDCGSMMQQCAKGCRWFPLVPIAIGVVLMMLGYYLDARITRVLWMLLAGLVILLGAFGFVMMHPMKKTPRG